MRARPVGAREDLGQRPHLHLPRGRQWWSGTRCISRCVYRQLQRSASRGWNSHRPPGVTWLGGRVFLRAILSRNSRLFWYEISARGDLICPLYVPRDPAHAGHIGYYAGEPIQSHMFASVEWELDPCPPGLTPSAPGFCCGPPDLLDPLEAGPAVAFDLSPFTAPFKIE
jgi:hypothetical protein